MTIRVSIEFMYTHVFVYKKHNCRDFMLLRVRMYMHTYSNMYLYACMYVCTSRMKNIDNQADVNACWNRWPGCNTYTYFYALMLIFIHA